MQLDNVLENLVNKVLELFLKLLLAGVLTVAYVRWMA